MIRRRGRQRGLGAVFVMGVLVLGSVLAATVARMSQVAAQSSASDLQLARMRASADAGIEWARWALMSGPWTACTSDSTTLDLRTSAGAYVSVKCSCTSYSEGLASGGAPGTTRMCALSAVACSSASCPDDALAQSSQSSYAEWERRLQVRQSSSI